MNKRNIAPTIGLGIFFVTFCIALFMYPSQDKARAKMHSSVGTLQAEYEDKIQELKCIQCRAFHERITYALKYDDADVYDEAMRSSDDIVNTYYGYINEICYMPLNNVTCVDEPFPSELSLDI